MGDERVERRLAAILAADVVGYSRLVGMDEEGTLAALKALRKSLIDPKITEHRGRIVKNTGDGALVEFASAVMGAVRRGNQRNGPCDSILRGQIKFRIGINPGDIVIEEGDIFGDGVNMAVRPEASRRQAAFASPRMSQTVRGNFDRDTEDIGRPKLKNIVQPVLIGAHLRHR
jgi:adenylate cyclase